MKGIFLSIMFIVAINISYAQENVFYLEQVPVIDGHKPDFIQDDQLRKFENVLPEHTILYSF